MDILPLFSCFETLVAKTAARRLRVIAQAMLTVTGRLTMLSLARWSGRGGSYRTIQRFFAAALPWIVVQGALQAIAFTCYFRMIVRVGGVFASQVAYVITLSGVLWGLVLFAEHPGWLTLPATGLIFAGLWLLTRRR